LFRVLGFPYNGNHKIKGQVVSILANGTPVGRWFVDEPKWYEAAIPRYLIANSTINIVMKFSDPMVPARVGHSGDTRLLGISIVTMVLQEVN